MATDVPVIPTALLVSGAYLTWFGVHYWRTNVRYPTDPIKGVLTGKGLPSATRAQSSQADLAQTLVNAAASTAASAAQAGATAAGWDTVRCSSFTGSQTASGHPMTATTIASPYLPLGTNVTVAYNGKQASGTVWDFGPADWVLRSDPNRFLDLATQMMAQLTGQADNLITAQYQVTSYGTGSVYRPNHPMTAKLKARWAG